MLVDKKKVGNPPPNQNPPKKKKKPKLVVVPFNPETELDEENRKFEEEYPQERIV